MRNLEKLTLKQFLEKKHIKRKDIKSVSINTIWNLINWFQDGKSNKNYRGRFSYFPYESTLIKLSDELWITKDQLVRLIENQYKVNKLNK